MAKYYRAIIKLNPREKDAVDFATLNNLVMDKPLSVVLDEDIEDGTPVIVFGKYLNTSFKWLKDVSGLIVDLPCWSEFEIILKGRELSPTEVEDIRKSI
ncbi:hypothetical protein VOWphi5012_071 [Vibrio phage phi50-12]|uniref:Uncharacterized protein n=1 Tax=Vibrio phage phi50-12 TaxID=2654972 RepID=A0A5P8PRH0_9CAUD|nr:hypothetical protein KNU82_gp071 [Vibrio phage phi50-12]QFR59855.1 hypothetical protein VOWphi5012_071 [Vibrio phage phi50-12]